MIPSNSTSALSDELERLRVIEARHNSLLEASSDLVFWVDRTGGILNLHASEPGELYVPEAEIVGRNMFELLPGDVAETLNEAIVRAFDVGLEQHVEYALPFPEGDRTFEGRVVPSRDGEVLFLVRNITEKRQAELELRRRERELKTIADHSPDIITRIDRSMRYVFVNSALTNMAGVPPEFFLGKTAQEIGFPKETYAPFEQALEEVFATGKKVSILEPFATIDGSLRYFQIFLVPERGESGEIETVLALSRDVTELKLAHQQIERANRTLEERVKERTEQLTALNKDLGEAVKMKDEFLASMSHELRTPLNGILGMTQALRAFVYGPLDPRMEKPVEIIEESGRHLLDLINDILDLSKIQAGKLQLEMTQVPAKSLCDAVLTMTEKAAERKRHKVTLDLDPRVNHVVADGRRLKQMLVNLLSNAIKFTHDGGSIQLKVFADAEKGVARFAVSDNGIGIAPDRLSSLFKPFTQLDSGLSRQHSGSGLGLSLVLNMAVLHGGGVEVDSKENQGSTFTISIPWRPDTGLTPSGQIRLSAITPLGVSLPDEGKGVKVLIAEDDEKNATLLSDYLGAFGYEIHVAGSGFEAIHRALEIKPDVILMDIQMPGMDGLEATKRIKANEALSNIPVLALTALAMPGDRKRCLDAGASAYLTKPLKLKLLKETISDALRHSRELR